MGACCCPTGCTRSAGDGFNRVRENSSRRSERVSVQPGTAVKSS
ncbi:unnamed protein product [[Actinomadura] parvosata subsp. kistnae]|nr:unnamed protein product [Actinomadura parvosata subsp. kistnae]